MGEIQPKKILMDRYYGLLCTAAEDRDASAVSDVPQFRRFSDFDQLRSLVSETETPRLGRQVNQLPFPSKFSFFKAGDGVAEERQQALEGWVNQLLQICGTNTDVLNFLTKNDVDEGFAEEEKREERGGEEVDVKGKSFRCLVRSIVRDGFEGTSKRVGELEVGQQFVAAASRRNDKGVVRLQLREGGWVSEKEASNGRVLVTAAPPKRRARTYRCVSDTVVTASPLLDSAVCGALSVGDTIRCSEALVDRQNHRRLRCELGWVSETSAEGVKLVVPVPDGPG